MMSGNYEAQAAVTIFGLDHPRLSRTLKGRLQKRRTEMLIDLMGAEDWADFKHRVGQIRGIDEAISECDRIERENERN